MSQQPTPAGALTTVTPEAALTMARKWNLIDPQGELWCVTCRDNPGTLPSLECEGCRDKRIRGWR